MKDLNVIVYTMKGCPFCVDFKELLTNEGIEFFDRDIDEYRDEYETFTQITENDMIPALLIIEGNDAKYESFLYAP
jgi:glutaredoxin